MQGAYLPGAGMLGGPPRVPVHPWQPGLGSGARLASRPPRLFPFPTLWTVSVATLQAAGCWAPGDQGEGP